MINPISRDVLGTINHLLQASPFSDLRSLVARKDGELFRLHGNVRSFYLKQLAQETIRRATQGIGVVNEVHVQQR